MRRINPDVVLYRLVTPSPRRRHPRRRRRRRRLCSNAYGQGDISALLETMVDLSCPSVTMLVAVGPFRRQYLMGFLT